MGFRIRLMALSAVWLAGTSLAAAAPYVPPEGAKPFEFKGIVASETTDLSKLFCITKSDDGADCLPADWASPPPRVADVIVLLPEILFYKGKLYSMHFGVIPQQLGVLTDAFAAKYGNPCIDTTEPWQSRAGAVFQNHVMSWCFSTGMLVVKAMGDRMDAPEVQYVDFQSAPPPPPSKVDF